MSNVIDLTAFALARFRKAQRKPKRGRSKPKASEPVAAPRCNVAISSRAEGGMVVLAVSSMDGEGVELNLSAAQAYEMATDMLQAAKESLRFEGRAES